MNDEQRKQLNELLITMKEKYEVYQKVSEEVLEEGNGFREEIIRKITKAKSEFHESEKAVEKFSINIKQVDELTKGTLLEMIKEKYKNSHDHQLIEIDSDLAAGLTLHEINKCLDESKELGDFILCTEGKKYGIA